MRRLYNLLLLGCARATALIPRRAQVDVGRGVLFYGRPMLRTVRGSQIRIGDGASIVSCTSRNPLGVNHRAVVRTLLPGAEITIGAGTGISGGAICAAISVTIGSGCLFGANVTVVDTDFHPISSPTRAGDPIPTPQPEDRVVIGNNVFVVTGATILKGVSIGHDCVIGAGAIVTGSCQAGTIFAGNPARQVGVVERGPDVERKQARPT